MAKRILLIVVMLLILIQFFKPEKNIHPGVQPQALATAFPVPAEVTNILGRACNDCHSNNTRYPWYNKVQPVAWWLRSHINEGKRELNFDEFTTYPIKKQRHKLEELAKTVQKGEMPLSSYTLIHKDARLSEAERQILINWANGLKKQVGGSQPE